MYARDMLENHTILDLVSSLWTREIVGPALKSYFIDSSNFEFIIQALLFNISVKMTTQPDGK